MSVLAIFIIMMDRLRVPLMLKVQRVLMVQLYCKILCQWQVRQLWVDTWFLVDCLLQVQVMEGQT